MGWKRTGAAVALTGAMMMAACSDDGDDGDDAASTTAPAAAPTTDPVAAATTEPVASTTGSSEAPVTTTETPAPPGDEIPAEVTAAIDAVLAKEEYRHATWGVMVRDGETGDVLVDVNGDSMYVTGSILKTLSAAGVLEAYGPDHTFATPVYGTGPVDAGTLRGDLILVASGGDFSFGLRDQPDGTLEYSSLPVLDHNEANAGLGAAPPPSGDPFAAFDDLAEQLIAAGVTSIEGDVAIDDRVFEAFTGWPDGVVAPIWFNENVIDITITPGAASGDPATVSWAPQTASHTVRSAVSTVADGEPAQELVAALVAPGVVEVQGTIVAGQDPTQRIYKVEDPSAWARTAFIESLERAGIAVAATPTGPNPEALLPAGPYDDAAKLAEHMSAPLSELVKVVLKVSFNRGADLLVCLTAVAAGSDQCEAGLPPTVDTIAALGIEDGTTFMFDGAGSDERDRTSPGSMTEFLRGAREAPWGAAFEDALPILGEDGTLATNQAGTPAAGNVIAKTGTRVAGTAAGQGLVTALTQVGYIDSASGRRLTYALMVRDVPIGEVEEFFAIGDDQGLIAAAIYEHY